MCTYQRPTMGTLGLAMRGHVHGVKDAAWMSLSLSHQRHQYPSFYAYPYLLPKCFLFAARHSCLALGMSITLSPVGIFVEPPVFFMNGFRFSTPTPCNHVQPHALPTPAAVHSTNIRSLDNYCSILSLSQHG